MIGSHNSFTYSPPVNKFYNLFKWLWRCQKDMICVQYQLCKVRYFDVRVYQKYDFDWRVAHGKVDLGVSFKDVVDIIEYFRKAYPNAICRIILEKGDHITFSQRVIALLASNDYYPILKQYVHQIIIKKGWYILYNNDSMNLEIKDYTYTPILSGKSFWYNLTHFKFDTIKHYAKKHNPVITQEMIEDKHIVYFMDYIKYY